MDLKTLPINIVDLVPQESIFKLQNFPHELVLRPWSVLIKTLAIKHFGSPLALQDALQKQNIEDVANICWLLLRAESKKLFNDEKGEAQIERFLDVIQSVQDQLNLTKAMLKTIGIGEPEFEKILASLPQALPEKPVDPKPKARKKTGAKSSTR